MDSKELLTPEKKAEAEATIRSVARVCRGPILPPARAEVNRLMLEGDMEGAKLLDAQSRSGCGADFNDIVVAGPWDAQTHSYRCPKCGCTGTYQSPSFSAE